VGNSHGDTPQLSSTAAFLIAKLGQSVGSRFAERLEPIGLRPRHCGVLSLLADGVPGSQLDLGKRLSVVPSAVVGLLDDLEELGAVERGADRSDRRRHAVALTGRGRWLLRRSQEIALALDLELLADLGSAERTAFIATLRAVAVSTGAVGD